MIQQNHSFQLLANSAFDHRKSVPQPEEHYDIELLGYLTDLHGLQKLLGLDVLVNRFAAAIY